MDSVGFSGNVADRFSDLDKTTERIAQGQGQQCNEHSRKRKRTERKKEREREICKKQRQNKNKTTPYKLNKAYVRKRKVCGLAG